MAATSRHAFAEDRQRAILDMLDRNASVQVSDVARALGVSTVTARSDLDALASAGKLRRTHGGAVSLHRTLTVSVQDERVNVHVEAKQAIARSAIDLVEPGNVLIVDSGTTALEFVRLLTKREGITVITADVTIADYIDRSLPGVDVIMLGGCLRKGHRYLSGPLAIRTLEALHADLAVICPGGFVPGSGFMTDYPQMAELKAAMIRAARSSVVLIDASKIDGSGTFKFADLADVNAIVCDADPAGALAAALEELPEDDRPVLHIA